MYVYFAQLVLLSCGCCCCRSLPTLSLSMDTERCCCCRLSADV